MCGAFSISALLVGQVVVFGVLGYVGRGAVIFR